MNDFVLLISYFSFVTVCKKKHSTNATNGQQRSAYSLLSPARSPLLLLLLLLSLLLLRLLPWEDLLGDDLTEDFAGVFDRAGGPMELRLCSARHWRR